MRDSVKSNLTTCMGSSFVTCSIIGFPIVKKARREHRNIPRAIFYFGKWVWSFRSGNREKASEMAAGRRRLLAIDLSTLTGCLKSHDTVPPDSDSDLDPVPVPTPLMSIT